MRVRDGEGLSGVSLVLGEQSIEDRPVEDLEEVLGGGGVLNGVLDANAIGAAADRDEWFFIEF